jgi:hypothetical protein
MSNDHGDREYSSHVTLMILGEDLVPAEVSALLGLRPNQSWKRNESGQRWGGWKKFLPQSKKDWPLDRQLRHWERILRGRGDTFTAISGRGNLCVLDCYIGSDATASIIFPVELQTSLAALGLELRLSIFAHAEG